MPPEQRFLWWMIFRIMVGTLNDSYLLARIKMSQPWSWMSLSRAQWSPQSQRLDNSEMEEGKADGYLPAFFLLVCWVFTTVSFTGKRCRGADKCNPSVLHQRLPPGYVTQSLSFYFFIIILVITSLLLFTSVRWPYFWWHLWLSWPFSQLSTNTTSLPITPCIPPFL